MIIMVWYYPLLDEWLRTYSWETSQYLGVIDNHGDIIPLLQCPTKGKL